MRWVSTQCDDLQRSFCELVELKTSLTFTSFIYLIESLTTFPFKSMSTELPLYLSLIIRLPHIRDEHSQTNFVISFALDMAVAFIHCSSNDIMYIFIAVKSTRFFSVACFHPSFINVFIYLSTVVVIDDKNTPIQSIKEVSIATQCSSMLLLDGLFFSLSLFQQKKNTHTYTFHFLFSERFIIG